MRYDWELLATGVHRCRLPFLDVTVGLVAGHSRVLLIDCGTTLAEAAGICIDALELTGRTVTDIVMTHHHFDHVLGSAGFPGAVLYAAEPVARVLAEDTAWLRGEAVRHGATADDVDAAIGLLRVPDHVVTHARIELGGRVVTVDHPGRGHTDHDLIVLVPAAEPGDRPVVFCGDLIEESADPAIDAGSHLDSWPASIERLLELGGPDARYVPGHGAAVDAEFLARQRDWLVLRR
ncbi:MAG: MBL fold metallo-hydrolase [Mycobacterium sp.]